MPDKAKPAEHNGDIWSRASTQYGAILAAKIVLFLLKVSMRDFRGRFASGKAAEAEHTLCMVKSDHKAWHKSGRKNSNCSIG